MPREPISKIETNTSDEIAETLEFQGEIDTADDKTSKDGAEPDDAEQIVQPPKKAPTRKPKKTLEPASSADAIAEAPKPKPTTTRQRKKNVELASPASETAEAPKPRPTTTRKPKKTLEPVSPITDAMETPMAALEATSVSPENPPVAEQPHTASLAEIVPAETIEAAPVAQEELPVPAEEAPIAQAEPVAIIEEVPAAQADPLVTTEEAPTAEEVVEPTPIVIEPIRVIEEEATAPVAIIEAVPTPAPATERRHLVKSAALVSIGNLGSSLIGMARQVVVTGLGSSIAGPFGAALTPANNFFQLLINGSVSGALVPTFNDYAAPEKREEMRRVVFTLVNLVFLVALLASIGYALIAPSFINLLVPGYNAADKLLTLQYSQIIFFSLAALGPFAVLLAALFALKEFGWPAFATAAYHVGIILGAIGISLFGSFYLGNMALPVGVLLGALGELALLLPGMRNQHFRYMFVLDLKHPALRRILKLYLPIAISFVFTTLLVFLDVNLWSQAPGNGAANTVAQITATALLQFPVGLVATALSFAVLPTLSEHAREGNNVRFKETLLLGFRLGLLLMIPAMVGMWVLRFPVVDLLFAHHHNSLKDAGLTALALQNYVYQLPFVAIDQLLISAFYARKNTVTPVVIGIFCIGFYLLVALPFYKTIGVPALAFANTVQNSMHAIILLILLRKAMGSLHIRTTLPAILKICLAAALMGVAAWVTLVLLGHVSLFSLNGFVGQLLTVLVAGGVAVAVYVGAVLFFKVEEINLVKGAVMAKLGKK